MYGILSWHISYSVKTSSEGMLQCYYVSDISCSKMVLGRGYTVCFYGPEKGLQVARGLVTWLLNGPGKGQ